MTAPRIDKSFEGLIRHIDREITGLERRQARSLPVRLSAGGEDVDDWNSALSPGFYWSDASAANSPGAGLPWAGVVVRLGAAGTVIQTLYQGSLGVPADASKPGMRRYLISGAWTPWTEIAGSGGSTSVQWADILGKPSTFPPSTHGHALTDANITGVLPASKVPTIDIVSKTSGILPLSRVGGVEWENVANRPTTFAPQTQTVFAATGGYDLNKIYGTGFYYQQIVDLTNAPSDTVNSLNILMILQITAASGGDAFGAQQLAWEMVADSNTNTYNIVRSWTRAGGPWFLPPVWGAWKRTDPTATTSVAGFVELATTAEATTGTDTVRAVTPAGLKAVGDTKAPLSHTHGLADITVTALGSTTDLNTLTTAGLYHQNQNASAGSGSNYPAAVAGLLEVYAASSMVYQRYTAYDGRGHWERSKYNTTWYGWRFISDSITDTTGTLPISRGGTGATTAAAALTALGAAASTHGHALTDSNITGILPAAQVPAATTSARGGIEIATQAEVDAGTDTVRAVTPATLKATLPPTALALPGPLYAYGPGATALTTAASSWRSFAADGVLIELTPARDLVVDVSVNAICKAASGGGYVMIGANVAGGVSLSPDADVSTGTQSSHLTPFTSSTVDTGLSSPTKRVTIPAGVLTQFSLWARRSVGSGTHSCNYPMITVLPVRWA